MLTEFHAGFDLDLAKGNHGLALAVNMEGD